jgi:hypothetical protein
MTLHQDKFAGVPPMVVVAEDQLVTVIVVVAEPQVMVVVVRVAQDEVVVVRVAEVVVVRVAKAEIMAVPEANPMVLDEVVLALPQLQLRVLPVPQGQLVVRHRRSPCAS